MKRKRVAVIMGGTSPEHEVSLASGQNVFANIDRQKFIAIGVRIEKSGLWRVDPELSDDQEIRGAIVYMCKDSVPAPAELPAQKGSLKPTPSYVSLAEICDLAFIALHGPQGEDGAVQGLLESLGVKYTGSGILASALGMNKLATKRMLQSVGIPVANHISVKRRDYRENPARTVELLANIGLPLVVKPNSMGSSIGVSIVKKRSELAPALEVAFGMDALCIVEEFIAGREIQVGILGNEDAIALPPIEVIPKKEFFDYEAKYNPHLATEIVPADLRKEEEKEACELALKTFHTLGCKGFARVDMFLTESGFIVSEINTIPGLTGNSLFPKEAMAAGISMTELVTRIIELGFQKYE